jgi:hypothetical protein
MIRQNPFQSTDQKQMCEINLSQRIITCPFGHIHTCRNNVMDGVYNEESNSQDRRFIEELQIGDVVLIPFAKRKQCILARIVSAPIYAIDTGLFTTLHDGKISISTEGDTPFRPVGRRIQILRDDIIFPDKRVLPRVSLCKLNPTILEAYEPY